MEGRGKGKLVAPKEEKRERSAGKKEKGGKHGTLLCDPSPLGNQTARTHARAKRNDFPVEHPPTSDVSWCCGQRQGGGGHVLMALPLMIGMAHGTSEKVSAVRNGNLK